MGLKLKYKLFLAVTAVVLGVLLATLQVAINIISTTSQKAVVHDLDRTRKVFEALQAARIQAMANQHQVLADSPQLKAAAEVKDPATMLDTLDEIASATGLPLLKAAGRKGGLLASWVQGLGKKGVRGGGDKPLDAVFEAATDPEEPQFLIGAWDSGEGLYMTATGPIILKRAVIGALRVGIPMDRNVAVELFEQTGSHAGFVRDGKVVASSLDEALEAELNAALVGMDKTMEEMADQSFEINLDGVPYVGQAVPLPGADGKTVAWQVQMRGLNQVLALLGSIQTGFLIVLVSGMAVAVVLSFLLAGGITKPVEQLVDATRQVEQGNLDIQLPVKGKDELARLASSFNAMTSELKEKERVKALFGKYLPKAVAERAMAHQGDIQLGGEMREVTCLFSDIRGFTAMSEKMPPQDIVAMLNDYYTRMIDVLFANDGTLDKTIGDAVMALFGAPVADEQGPAKAVRTALGMMAELDHFNQERRNQGLQPLEIGIGINTGQVVAGNLGSTKQLSYTVIGEEVNLASRLCGKAAAGQVLVSENTWRKVKWQFEFERLEPITVKNVSQPVPVYQVLGEKADATPEEE